MNEITIEATGLRKRYGGVRALDGVNLTLRAGEVHALVGENGAGKSTLIKILGGIEMPDGGVLKYFGEAATLAGPKEAGERGIAIIHQELELAPQLTVAENVFMGQLPHKGWLVDGAELERRTAAVLQQIGAHFTPSALVESLRTADRQVVEIAKAMVREAKVLVLDEPTSALPPVEAERLLEKVRALRTQGVAILYVSHRLDEVLTIADRITVLRDGRNVASFTGDNANRDDLVAAILGRELQAVEFPRSEPSQDVVVACQNLNVAPSLHGVDFEVRRGEVVGFFGLLGAGQNLIAEALYGLQPNASADIRIGGHAGLPGSSLAAINQGFGYVPSDRKGEGLALGISIHDNILLAHMDSFSRFGLLQHAQARTAAKEIVKRLDVRCHSEFQAVGELSGGNQQKVVLGRWLSRGSKILLLNEPTRGVDVGAKAQIFRLLRDLAQEGATVLLQSSDAEEVKTVCDRAYVLKQGRMAAELTGSQLTINRLIGAAL